MNKDEIQKEIGRFVAQRQLLLTCKTSWSIPLVGFSSADDPLFRELKKVVSKTHALPKDLLPSAKTVIAFFIPFSQSIITSNEGGYFASREWAQGYVQTNNLIKDLGEHLKSLIEAAGYETITFPSTHNFDKDLLISDWSHRHVAFIAGLGRFGINNMLITEKGCCGRFGSCITSLPVPADERPGEEFCLYRYNSSCLLCIDRCVGKALFQDHFDRHNCYNLCKENEAFFEDLERVEVCGKCLIGLPCSSENPVSVKG